MHLFTSVCYDIVCTIQPMLQFIIKPYIYTFYGWKFSATENFFIEELHTVSKILVKMMMINR